MSAGRSEPSDAEQLVHVASGTDEFENIFEISSEFDNFDREDLKVFTSHGIASPFPKCGSWSGSGGKSPSLGAALIPPLQLSSSIESSNR